MQQNYATETIVPLKISEGKECLDTEIKLVSRIFSIPHLDHNIREHKFKFFLYTLSSVTAGDSCLIRDDLIKEYFEKIAFLTVVYN